MLGQVPPRQLNYTWEGDGDDDPFASDVEADLEEDEGVMEDEQSKLQLTIAFVNKLHLYANHMKATGLVIFEPIDSAIE